MAGSINKAIIVGNVGKDPVVKTFDDGGEVANLSIATSENWKDKNTGERKEKTEWHNVVIRSESLINVVKNYVKKGSKLYVEGQLQTRKWHDGNGLDRYTTEIVLGGFNSVLTMLDSKKDGDASEKTPHDQAKANAFQSQDDEIPF